MGQLRNHDYNASSPAAYHHWAFPEDIPGLRVPDEVDWPKRYRSLKGRDLWEHLRYLAMPQAKNLLNGQSAHTLNFQPSPDTRTQDRYVVKELNVHGSIWTFSGVFDGHLGDYTADHVARHLPMVVEDFLREAHIRDPSSLGDPEYIAQLLSHSIEAFDQAIVDDVLSLFEGGLDGLVHYTDSQIREIINDEHRGGTNWKKARLCMYGCCSCIALVCPNQANLWVAQVGDSQAKLVMVTPVAGGDWNVDIVTTEHNGSNDDEVERVQREHPEEPECVLDRRVLGALAPFRCLGDVAFKQPPAFSRRIIYNIEPGFSNIEPWEAFLRRNRTPPYIVAQPEVTHRLLSSSSPSSSSSDPSRPTFLIITSDGFSDICSSRPEGQHGVLTSWAHGITQEKSFEVDKGLASSNRAVRLLWHALGGPDDDRDEVSKVLTLDMDGAWIDDTSIVVQTLT
ncbi:phosphatase 2C-like domain-containing protein [Flagelloscypha sp. PMI_526]|nr:phosphatase 2C-like domain-containing protein [Flagelloscypha sp. PMI_526]